MKNYSSLVLLMTISLYAQNPVETAKTAEQRAATSLKQVNDQVGAWLAGVNTYLDEQKKQGKPIDFPMILSGLNAAIEGMKVGTPAYDSLKDIIGDIEAQKIVGFFETLLTTLKTFKKIFEEMQQPKSAQQGRVYTGGAADATSGGPSAAEVSKKMETVGSMLEANPLIDSNVKGAAAQLKDTLIQINK